MSDTPRAFVISDREPPPPFCLFVYCNSIIIISISKAADLYTLPSLIDFQAWLVGNPKHLHLTVCSSPPLFVFSFSFPHATLGYWIIFFSVLSEFRYDWKVLIVIRFRSQADASICMEMPTWKYCYCRHLLGWPGRKSQPNAIRNLNYRYILEYALIIASYSCIVFGLL